MLWHVQIRIKLIISKAFNNVFLGHEKAFFGFKAFLFKAAKLSIYIILIMWNLEVSRINENDVLGLYI